MIKIVEAYVRLILKGVRCYKEVPVEVKDQVKQRLIELGREDLVYVE
ncbi:MAG: CD1375 family protein [bacterium]|nr:CD1375 family protein [bacterium]